MRFNFLHVAGSLISGDFVIVEPIEEGNKVKAEIVQILTKDHIRYFKNESAWPKEFDADADAASGDAVAKSEDNDRDMFPSSEDENDESDVDETNNPS